MSSIEYLSIAIALAPSWSHGSKSVQTSRNQSRYRWLPRGAMDLNRISAVSVCDVRCWLPRGAMDLNPLLGTELKIFLGWLPRGAMDLNTL